MGRTYPEIYMPTHHRARSNGCVDRHIIEAEKMIGRELRPEEVVHHKDQNRRNFDQKNLMVFVSESDHARFHKTGICVETDECGVYIAPLCYINKCLVCGQSIRNTQHGKCKRCYALEHRKVEHPSADKLSELLQNNSFVAIGKIYGVSDNTVRKWCKAYGIVIQKH